MIRHLPIAWLQLSHGRTKLLVALAGVLVADLLMWMQLGFLDSVFVSATTMHRRLRGDLLIVSRQTQSLTSLESFSRRELTRALAHPAVAEAHPLYMAAAKWKNPWTGQKRSIFVYGMDGRSPVMEIPGLDESWGAARESDVRLFDAGSRPEFGPVEKLWLAGEEVSAEVANRKITIGGLTRLGASFGADGNMFTSSANFQRLFPTRAPGIVELGVLRLRPGSDVEAARAELLMMLGDEVTVITPAEFAAMERAYLRNRSPIGFIFTLGTVVGFFVGFAIVYQVLHTDVTQHLPQYATLKAIGYTDHYLFGVVLQEALILALLGFVPATLMAAGLYTIARTVTRLPMELTWSRGATVLGLTLILCILSGAFAMRKLRTADPAEVF